TAPGTEGESQAHMMLGYTKLYQGNNTPTDLKTYLESYIANQYYAVTNISRFPGSSIYGLEWDEKPTGAFNGQSQAAAISVLLGGMTLTQGGDSGSPQPNPTPSTNTSATVPEGAIAGSVMGGIAGISLIVLGIWLYRWQGYGWRKKSRKPSSSQSIVDPFPQETPGPLNAHDLTGISGTHQTNWKLSEKQDAASTTAEDCANTGRGVGSSSSQSVDDTIEFLLLELNRRLRDERRQLDNRQWDPEESPPGYPESEQG
ncbi:hypothetical protein V5O48_017585, partial [Marasmius crinis-equi]